MAWTPPVTWTAGSTAAGGVALFNQQIRDNELVLGGPWPAYTPTVGASTTPPGTSTLRGSASITQGTVLFKIYAVLSSAGSGAFTFALPTPALETMGDFPLSGFGVFRDVSASTSTMIFPVLASSSSLRLRLIDGSLLGAANPVAAAVGDVIMLQGSYEAA